LLSVFFYLFCVDLLEYSLDELDTDLLDVLTSEWQGRQVRLSHNAVQLAKLYPVWYISKLRQVPVFFNGKYAVRPIRLRYFSKTYYSWIKHIDIPKLNWVLITLTLSRSWDLVYSWANIGFWISDFFRRFRAYLRKKGYRNFRYFWVIEVHEDGYPRVHILASFPFVSIERIYGWWRASSFNLSAFQGVDVKFIGRDTEKIKAYLLKYLVKSAHKYWAFSLRDNKVRVRLSTCLMWYFRVRLFSMSRNFIRPSLSSSSSLLGFVNLYDFYRVYFLPLSISFSEFFKGFYDCAGFERDPPLRVHIKFLEV